MHTYIVDWLKTKRNYVYYNTDSDSSIIFDQRFAEMLFHTRVSFKYLSASDCYIINVNDRIEINSEYPDKYKYNFENFNIKRNEYIYNMVRMNEIVKHYTIEDTSKNRAFILMLFNELNHDYTNNNKFLNHKTKYKDIFFDVNDKNFLSFIKDAKDCLKSNTFNFDEFKLLYIDKIKEKIGNLKEIGIYYPFIFNHNIFDNKHYPFEINCLKFFKRKSNLETIVERFYKEFGVNSNISQKIFDLKSYFNHPGFQYREDFAYFNPIIHEKKYSAEYEKLEAHMKKNNFDFKIFIFEWFEFLNEVQIVTVKHQQQNLINDFSMKRSRKRRNSVRDLIEIRIKELNGNLSNHEELYLYAILDSFRKQPSNFIFDKNTKIDDLDCYKLYPDYVKQDAQIVLSNLLITHNKDATSNLKYIYQLYLAKLELMIQKYELKNSQKKVLKNMILDLILFYKSIEKEKLSKLYNSSLEKIYDDLQHLDFENLIDLNFQKEFINKYSYKFEKNIPFEINNEYGGKKSFYTYGQI
jgi:hypothetical protein